MKTIRDDLEKIIGQSDIPDDWKKILQETMKSVITRNDSVLSEIRQNVLQEKSNLDCEWSPKWNIVTALVATNRIHDMAGFRSLSFDKTDNLLGEPLLIDITGNFFLDCSYEETVNLCSDEYSDEYPYRGYVDIRGEKIPFRYRLAHDLYYVNDERILFNTADIYQIKRPVIFSPYSRRAVKIQIPRQYVDVAELLEENIDDMTPYLLEENKLKGKLVTDKRLMWNIQTAIVPLPQYTVDDDENTSFFAPYGDNEIYRYEFRNLRANEFICPDDDDLKNVMTAQITSKKDEERQTITLITKKQLTHPCTSIRIIQTQDNNFSDNSVFHNYGYKAEYICFTGERLRTRGDIERILYGLKMSEKNLICSFQGIYDEGCQDFNVIQPYNRELMYGIVNSRREQSLYKTRRKFPICCLKFTGSNKFLTDYASYVLSFLENRYPEFQWVGVR
ncbi:MAG: hypothetical protein K6G55_04575 [Selenomonadaceae bacterium]|nr:hypothetical protein [Selenomonadaceae bacterium]